MKKASQAWSVWETELNQDTHAYENKYLEEMSL